MCLELGGLPSGYPTDDNDCPTPDPSVASGPSGHLSIPNWLLTDPARAQWRQSHIPWDQNRHVCWRECLTTLLLFICLFHPFWPPLPGCSLNLTKGGMDVFFRAECSGVTFFFQNFGQSWVSIFTIVHCKVALFWLKQRVTFVYGYKRRYL